ncbi:MAG: ABC transporter permease, partial [Oscillospiraceae bacterium]
MKSRSLAAPYLVWMALFTIVPLAIVAYFAFTDSQTGEFTMKNIANLGNYMPILIKSIWLALIASLICLVIGYPVAYYIAGCKETTQRFLYMLVMLPMCISFL